MKNDYAEHTIRIQSKTVELVELRLQRDWGVERWGVAIGVGGKILDYIEYARQRGSITAIYHVIDASSPLYRPMPGNVHDAVLDHLKQVAAARYEQECLEAA